MNSKLNAALFHQGKHLQDNEMVDAAEACPICLSAGLRRMSISLQHNPEVNLLTCTHCGGMSASKMPTDEALAKYYESYYSDQADKHTFHGFWRLARHIFRNVDLSFMKNSSVIRILDFGGGDGSLAMDIGGLIQKALPGVAIEVTLIDFNSERSYESNNIRLNAYKDSSQINGTFHIILASAILEHIPHVNPVIHDLVKRLSPGGYFYARTPYVVPFKKIIKKLDFTFPAHVHDMGPSFWNRFQSTFDLNWRMIFSRTSIVETSFREAFVRTLMAYVLKFPSRLEEQLSGHRNRRPVWNFVGGWEVLFINPLT